MLTEKAINDICASGARRLIVAFSGGMDSHALLHALVHSDIETPVHAVHINHGISPYANQWQAHCEDVCRKLGVAETSICVSVTPGAGVEERARDARYEAFNGFLQSDDLLLLAHHADDQVETALLTLLRGSGRPGLSGMPSQRKIGRARLLRPMLDLRREQIEAYAVAHDLSWVVDHSNADEAMNRNYIRHRLLPVMKARWPDVSDTLLRRLDIDEEVSQLVDYTAENDLAPLLSKRGGVALAGLELLPPVRRKNLLRFWTGSLGLPVPGHGILDRELSTLIEASPDSAPLLTWQGVCLRRAGGELFLTSPLAPIDAGAEMTVGRPGVLETQAGLLSVEKVKGRGLCADDLSRLSVRFRRGGERIRLGKHRTLKNVFQQTQTPVWLRDRLPLVYEGDELIAVAGLPAWNIEMQTATDHRATGRETGYEFLFEVAGQPYSR